MFIYTLPVTTSVGRVLRCRGRYMLIWSMGWVRVVSGRGGRESQCVGVVEVDGCVGGCFLCVFHLKCVHRYQLFHFEPV